MYYHLEWVADIWRNIDAQWWRTHVDAVPIDDVYLLTLSPYDVDEYRVDNRGELILQQYEQWGVVCVTSAATYAAPNVSVTVHERDVSGRDVTGRDITELFTRSVERRPVLLESGLIRQHVTVRLKYVTSQPEAEMNGKMLKCTAVGQPGFSDVHTTAILVVNCTCLPQCPYRECTMCIEVFCA